MTEPITSRLEEFAKNWKENEENLFHIGESWLAMTDEEARSFANEIEQSFIAKLTDKQGIPWQVRDVCINAYNRTFKILGFGANKIYVADTSSNDTGPIFSVDPKEISHYLKDANECPYLLGDTLYSDDPTTLMSAKVVDINKDTLDIMWEDGVIENNVDPKNLCREPPASISLAQKLLHSIADDLDGYLRDCEINADKVDEYIRRLEEIDKTLKALVD